MADEDETTNDEETEASEDEESSEEESSEEEASEEESDEEETSDDDDSDDDSDDDEASDDDRGTADDSDDSDAEAAEADDDEAEEEDEEEEPKPRPKKKKKVAKKKTTKKKKRKKRAAASDDDDDERPRKKKKRKTAGPAPEREAQPKSDGGDDNNTMVLLGVFVAAIALVAGLWYYNQQSGTEEAEQTPTVETSSDEETPEGTPQLPTKLGEIPGMPPRPEPIPAPEDVAEPPENAESTESGLRYRVITEGTGTEHPGETDRVTVHYTGWTTDGRMFDSSRMRNSPATFPLNRVIPGWTEGVQLMVTGETTRFWIPEDLAYRGRPGAPAGMLVFDVELISFETPPPPPETPDDVAAPPDNAETTESGLAHRLLEAGTGTEHPEATSRVSVHYTGWTTDGEMFDSSVTRGRPAQFQLNRVIPGWTEGVQLMVVGERRRLWIPEALAYQGRPGAPAGMLVFDVELLEILPAPAANPMLPPGHPQ